uniref:LysR family transcriptional regulator n=1 Tax=Vaginimicrobium propionicum TaxID=1871034 RepID=UPI0009711D2D|nr:LysR family transcriptional regulator [Vaginimicrobium propionicum]
MRFEQLGQIIKVAECGSITQAAYELFTSQPGLTKSIAALEHEFGTKFFLRTPHGVQLTADGKEFLHQAREISVLVEHLRSSMRGKESARIQQLSVASQQFDFISSLFLDIYRKHKNNSLRFDLQQTNRSEVIENVIDGKATFGILVRTDLDDKTFMWPADIRTLEITILDTGPIFVCVGPQSQYYEATTVPRSEIESGNLLTLDMRVNDFSRIHSPTKQIVAFNSIDLCQNFLNRTDALLFVSKWTRGCFSSPLRCIPVTPSFDAETQLIVVRRRSEELFEVEEEFLGQLRDNFS